MFWSLIIGITAFGKWGPGPGTQWVERRVGHYETPPTSQFSVCLPVREHGRHPEVSPSFQVIGDSGVVLVGVWCFSEPVERQQCGSLL